MDSLCIYPTVFTEQMSIIFFFFLYLLIWVLFVLFLFKPGPPLPSVHTLHVQHHHSDSHMLLFKEFVFF